MSKYDITYQNTPQWVVGWNVDNPLAVTPLGEHDHYPYDHVGRVTSVFKSGEGNAPTQNCSIITLELTSEEYSAVLNRDVKIQDGQLVPITFLDRHGEQVAIALEDAFGSREDAQAAELASQLVASSAAAELNSKYTTHTADMTAIYTMPSESEYAIASSYNDVYDAACDKLAETYTHTGTGYYAVKKSVTANADTQNGAPVVNTITLNIGGLGTADAFKGGYVTNTSIGETYSIISHTDNTVTLEAATLINWLDTHNLIVYDAWATIAGAEAAAWADQGATAFTSTQTINVGAGTWVETLTANNSFVCTPRHGLVYDGNDRGAVINASGTLARHIHAGNTTNNTFRGFHITGTSTGIVAVERISTSTYNMFDNCLFDCDSSAHIISYIVYSWYVGCEFDGSNGSRQVDYAGNVKQFLRCKVHNLSNYMVTYLSLSPVIIDSCEIYDVDKIVYVTDASRSSGHLTFTNNTVYDCNYLGFSYSSFQSLEMQNNIVHTINIALFYENDATAKYDYGTRIVINNNTYWNIAKYLYSPSEGDITTFSAWQARNASDGNETNSNERDPLLTDPANADFTLQTSSPERHARPSVGCAFDINGNARNCFRVSTGAHDIGDPGATWSGGSNISATDDLNGETITIAWDAATVSPATTLGFEYVVKNNVSGAVLATVDDSTTSVAVSVAASTEVAVGTRYHQVTESVSYDADTDTAAPTKPISAQPSISGVTDNGGGSYTIAVVAGTTPDGVTDDIYLYYREFDTANWTLGGSRTDSGDITITGLTADRYEYIAVATRYAAVTENPSKWSQPEINPVVPDQPNQPTITGITEDGAGAFTVALTTDNQDNYLAVAYRSFDTSDWTIYGTTRQGDGDISLTGLGGGRMQFTAFATELDSSTENMSVWAQPAISPPFADAPNAPVISSIVKVDATTVRVYLTTDDQTNNLFVFYRTFDTSGWTEASTYRTGDGYIDITGLTAAKYQFDALATQGTESSDVPSLWATPYIFTLVGDVDHSQSLRSQHVSVARSLNAERWGLPVTLRSPDGVLYDTDATTGDPLKAIQILNDYRRLDPETGEAITVHEPMVIMSRESLVRVPVAGETWHIRLPEDPQDPDTLSDYVLSGARAVEGGRSLGFIRLYPIKAEQSS